MSDPDPLFQRIFEHAEKYGVTWSEASKEFAAEYERMVEHMKRGASSPVRSPLLDRPTPLSRALELLRRVEVQYSGGDISPLVQSCLFCSARYQRPIGKFGFRHRDECPLGRLLAETEHVDGVLSP